LNEERLPFKLSIQRTQFLLNMKFLSMRTILGALFIFQFGNAQTRADGQENANENVKKRSVTYLGVKTSKVPSVVRSQLGLAEDVGLVVTNVAPDTPAAAAGIRQDDILKTLDDTVLTDGSQLGTLLQSYAEGTNVTLTILREGQEQKITVSLAKRDVPERSAASSKAGKEIHTETQWWGIINEDSKISSMESRLGKPDSIEEGDSGRFRAGFINTSGREPCYQYRWYGHVDVGTTHTEALEVIALIYPEYGGIKMIVALRNPVSSDLDFFSWTPKYR